MDYQTARGLLIKQTFVIDSAEATFMTCLKQGEPPIPGQVTSILLALKVVFEALKDSPNLERELVYALHMLAWESRQHFETNQRSGVLWPPLLDEDLQRIAKAVKSILSGTWDLS